MGVAGVVQSVIDWKCKLGVGASAGEKEGTDGEGEESGQCKGDPTDGRWSVHERLKIVPIKPAFPYIFLSRY